MSALLKNLVVTRIDRVDLGANQKADILLWKRKPTSILKDYGIMVEIPPEPKTTGELIAERDTSSEIWTLTYAFEDSVRSILASEADDKAALIVQSLEEFLEAARKRLPDGVAKGAAAVTANESDVEGTVRDAVAQVRDVHKRLEAHMAKSNNDPVALDLKAIPEAQRAAVEALQKRAGEIEVLEKRAKDAEAKATSLEAENAELKKQLPAETEEEKLRKALPETVRKRMDEQDTKIAKMQEREEEAESIAKSRKEVPNLVGTTHEEFGPLLRRIAKGKTTDKDEAEILRLMKAYAEFAKSSKLLGEIGASGGSGSETEGSAWDRVQSIAKRFVKEGKAKTEREAVDLAWKENPDLYKQHMKERRESAH